LPRNVGLSSDIREDVVESSSREQQKYAKYLGNLFLVYKDYHREVEEILHE